MTTFRVLPHPDVPKEAFEILRDFVCAGRGEDARRVMREFGAERFRDLAEDQHKFVLRALRREFKRVPA